MSAPQGPGHTYPDEVQMGPNPTISSQADGADVTYTRASRAVMPSCSALPGGHKPPESEVETAAQAGLPPRILVEMPDADLCIGVDKLRLTPGDSSSTLSPAKNVQQDRRQPAPRTVSQWSEAVACQYLLALKKLLVKRSRLLIYPIGAYQLLRACADGTHAYGRRPCASTPERDWHPLHSVIISLPDSLASLQAWTWEQCCGH